jgi:hypothetical protein
MDKETFVSNGQYSDEVANFVFSKDRNNKALNQEGMEIGDTITLAAMPTTVTENIIGGKAARWLDIICTGDRSAISISRLVGTAKVAKYFGDEIAANPKILKLPRREADALEAIRTQYIGHTFRVAAIAEECGQFEQTYYLFEEVTA